MKSCSAVAWSPTNSTQLVAACDHQLSPTLHRWDLRSPTMPFELLGHDQVSCAAASPLCLTRADLPCQTAGRSELRQYIALSQRGRAAAFPCIGMWVMPSWRAFLGTAAASPDCRVWVLWASQDRRAGPNLLHSLPVQLESRRSSSRPQRSALYSPSVQTRNIMLQVCSRAGLWLPSGFGHQAITMAAHC